MRNWWMASLVSVAVLLFGIFFVNANALATDGLVLYVSEGCNHCAKVEKFIEDNSLGDEITIKDILVDETASEEFTEFSDMKEIPLEERGVPILIDEDENWYSGDTTIIDYLSDRFRIETEPRETETSDMILLIVGGAIAVSVVGYGIFKAVDGKGKK